MRAALIILLGASTSAAQDTTRPGGTGEAWQIIQPAQSTLVFARDGSFIGEIGKQMRTSVPLASLPPHVAGAFIAVEDQRFYQHNGVDMVGVLGAVKDNVMGDRRGASTIPQLLVGMMHPDLINRREVSGMSGIQRKIREQNAAREMTKRYSKNQVLEAFLNQVDLGHNWFGVEAAARHYFGTSASRLTVAQSASLAALPKSPPGYDPIRRPEANRERRNTIIQLMLDQKFITPEVAARAKAEPVVVAPNSGFSVPSSYFVDAVRMEADKAGIPVLNGGYRIYTTLDVPLQQSAVTALVNGTAAIEKLPGYKHISQAQAQSQSQALGSTRLVNTDYLQGAIVVMDPYTGDVRALIGGRNYPLAPFNRATLARRQPGSAIKPIVYAKAIEQGIPVNRIYNDTILKIPLEERPGIPARQLGQQVPRPDDGASGTRPVAQHHLRSDGDGDGDGFGRRAVEATRTVVADDARAVERDRRIGRARDRAGVRVHRVREQRAGGRAAPDHADRRHAQPDGLLVGRVDAAPGDGSPRRVHHARRPARCRRAWDRLAGAAGGAVRGTAGGKDGHDQ